MGRKPKPVFYRIMDKTEIPRYKNGNIKEHECWIYKGAKNNAGYGLIRQEGVKQMVLVHRVIGQQHGLSLDKEVQHTCLNSLCVNPKHLVNGDSKTRTQRMEKQGSYRPFRDKDFMYPVCEHCGGQDYLPHFKRKHSLCQYHLANKYTMQTILGKKHAS